MRNCTDIQSRLSLYLDNELQGDERVEFESHLRECLPCRLLAQAEQRFLGGVRAAKPMYVASPDLTDRVRAVLDLPAKDSVSSHRSRVIVTMAAAALLLLLLPILIWRARDR